MSHNVGIKPSKYQNNEMENLFPSRTKFRQFLKTFKEDSKTTLSTDTPCKLDKP